MAISLKSALYIMVILYAVTCIIFLLNINEDDSQMNAARGQGYDVASSKQTFLSRHIPLLDTFITSVVTNTANQREYSSSSMKEKSNIAGEFSLDKYKFETVVSDSCTAGSTWPSLPIYSNSSDRHGNTCMEPRFSPVALPHTALASFPGCGNTWARHLIQQLTGVWTGSMYRDHNLLLKGFHGEGVQNSSVVVSKTHWPYIQRKHSTAPHYLRTVLVLRSPQECLLAEFHRRHSHGHTGLAAPELFNSSTWEEYIHMNAKFWHWFYQSWLTKDTCTFILDFERLKSNLATELKHLARFLGVNEEVIDERIECVVRNSEGSFKRKQSKSLSVFSDKQRKAVDYYGSLLVNLVEERAHYKPMFKW